MMTRPNFCYFQILIFSILSFEVSAQNISNVNARLAGEDVIISYDLVGAKVGQRFLIELLYSEDNYQAPLRAVSGDVGENQLGGFGKQIIWRAKEELGVFTGNITFEVRSTISFSPLQITSPTSSSSFKPGNSLPIKWNGGMPDSQLQIELMKTNTLNRSIGSTANNGMYNWSIPKDVAKGADYQIKMYDVRDRVNTEILSSNFGIKGKGGAGKFLIPLAAVGAGAGIYMALQGGEDDTPLPIVDDNVDLPSPPDPDGSFGSARIKKGRPWFTIPISF